MLPTAPWLWSVRLWSTTAQGLRQISGVMLKDVAHTSQLVLQRVELSIVPAVAHVERIK